MRKKNGQMLKSSPFDYWKMELFYINDLNEHDKKWITDFYNEFVLGWFLKDRDLIHNDKNFLKLKLAELKKNKEAYKNFKNLKAKWESKNKKKISEPQFVLQRIKQVAWNDTDSRRFDFYALKYRNQAPDESESEKSENEEALENITYTKDISEFQAEFLKAYKEDKVINFLIEWFDYALDIQEMEEGLYHVYVLGEWWEKLKGDYLNSDIRLTFFKNMFHRIACFALEKCEKKNDAYLIYKDIIKVFENFYNSKEQILKGNVYGK